MQPVCACKKSTKFFLNLEKHRTIQSQIHSVSINQEEITDQDEINMQIFSFYRSLSSRKVQFQTDKIKGVFRKYTITKTH